MSAKVPEGTENKLGWKFKGGSFDGAEGLREQAPKVFASRLRKSSRAGSESLREQVGTNKHEFSERLNRSAEKCSPGFAAIKLDLGRFIGERL